MNRNASWGLILLISSACAKSPPTGEANASAEALRPGQYEFALHRHAAGPGYTSEPEPYIDSFCKIRRDDRRVGNMAAPVGCIPQAAKASHGELSATMMCHFPELGSGPRGDAIFKTHGTYDTESVNLMGEATAHGVTVHATYTLKRKGDC